MTISKSVIRRFWAKVDKCGPCWLWLAYRSKRGYGQFKIDGNAEKAHRVAFTITKGPIPTGLKVLHTCDNPPCVNPAHLFSGTQLDNVRDCIAKGRAVLINVNGTGVDNNHAKVTPEIVVAIRRDYATGFGTLKSIGASHGLKKSATFQIVHRKTWRHVA